MDIFDTKNGYFITKACGDPPFKNIVPSPCFRVHFFHHFSSILSVVKGVLNSHFIMTTRSIRVATTSSCNFIFSSALQHHQKLRGIRCIFSHCLGTINNPLPLHHLQFPSSSSSSYRAFSDAPKPFSRKRPSSESTTNTAIPNQTFNQHAIVAILHIYRSIDPLLELNEGFHWSCSRLDMLQQIAAKYTGTRTADLTVLDPLVLADDSVTLCLNAGNKCSYIFSVDRQLERLNVQSPISGTYSYTYQEEQGLWYSVIDNHDMRGLITRDLLRHCRGCPMF